MIKKYIKKSIGIEAIKWTGTNLEKIKSFVGENLIYDTLDSECKLLIKTLEGNMIVSKGDYIIKGIKGEFYPIKQDIFEESYTLISSNEKNDNSSMLSKKEILIGKYVIFNDGLFLPNEKVSELLYTNTKLICSYSGVTEWCNHVICELIDIYSGTSIYNYAFNCYKHEEKIKNDWNRTPELVIDWIFNILEKEWFKLVISSFENIIESIEINKKIFKE